MIYCWTKKPAIEKSKMPGAVRRFGLYALPPYPEEKT